MYIGRCSGTTKDDGGVPTKSPLLLLRRLLLDPPSISLIVMFEHLQTVLPQYAQRVVLKINSSVMVMILFAQEVALSLNLQSESETIRLQTRTHLTLAPEQGLSMLTHLDDLLHMYL